MKVHVLYQWEHSNPYLPTSYVVGVYKTEKGAKKAMEIQAEKQKIDKYKWLNKDDWEIEEEELRD